MKFSERHQKYIETNRSYYDHSKVGFETLLREINRLECYVEALEKRLSSDQIGEAMKEGSKKFVGEA